VARRRHHNGACRVHGAAVGAAMLWHPGHGGRNAPTCRCHAPTPLSTPMAPRSGRKNAALGYVITYSLSCCTKHSPNFWVLMVGRVLGGIATSLLYSAFESWLVAEHFKRGFSGARARPWHVQRWRQWAGLAGRSRRADWRNAAVPSQCALKGRTPLLSPP
jgi:MFS family permease